MNTACVKPNMPRIMPARSAAAASRAAFNALLLRDLTVLKKNLGVFIARTLFSWSLFSCTSFLKSGRA
jgi:hypothetical protein